MQEKQAEIVRQRREQRGEAKEGVLEEADESEVSEEGTVGPEGEEEDDEDDEGDKDEDAEWHGEGSGSWQPGQGVFVDHAAIMDIIVNHLSYPG